MRDSEALTLTLVVAGSLLAGPVLVAGILAGLAHLVDGRRRRRCRRDDLVLAVASVIARRDRRIASPIHHEQPGWQSRTSIRPCLPGVHLAGRRTTVCVHEMPATHGARGLDRPATEPLPIAV